MTPFDYINCIVKKIDRPSDMAGYNIFLTNRYFSLFPDTILYAEEMNSNALSSVCKELHYTYYDHNVRKGYKFAGKDMWKKREDDAIIIYLRDFYELSHKKAMAMMNTISKKQKSVLIEEINLHNKERGHE